MHIVVLDLVMEAVQCIIHEKCLCLSVHAASVVIVKSDSHNEKRQ